MEAQGSRQHGYGAHDTFVVSNGTKDRHDSLKHLLDFSAAWQLVPFPATVSIYSFRPYLATHAPWRPLGRHDLLDCLGLVDRAALDIVCVLYSMADLRLKIVDEQSQPIPRGRYASKATPC